TCSNGNLSPDGTESSILQASAPCTPAQNNSVVVFAGGTLTGATYTAGSGFSLPVQATQAFASTAIELAVQATATTVTGSMTISSADQWGALRRVLICNGSCPGTAPSAPLISSVSPTSGPIGTPVTISGSNFGASKGSSTLTFNGVAASPTN